MPLLRALHQSYPDATIDVLLPPSLVNLFELCPYIHAILIEPRSKRDLRQMIQARQYDTVLLMRRSVSQALLLTLAGIPRRIGFDEQRFFPPLSYRRWGWFLTQTVPFPPVDTRRPQVETYLSLLKPLTGREEGSPHLELWSTDTDRDALESLLLESGVNPSGPIAVFHATSASREKAMGIEPFIPALQALDRYPMQIIAVGTAEDAPFYEAAAEMADVPITNLCGKTTLRQTYSLMQHVQLLLTLDSAPVHLATAAAVPYMVVIYGPTNEHQWRPYPYSGQFTPVINRALNCRPCVPKTCAHNRCRTDITAQQILEAVEGHLKRFAATEPARQ